MPSLTQTQLLSLTHHGSRFAAGLLKIRLFLIQVYVLMPDVIIERKSSSEKSNSTWKARN